MLRILPLCLSLLLVWLMALPAAAAALTDWVAAYPAWRSPAPLAPVTRESDLVYPDWFAGHWQVTSTLTAMEAPLAPEIVSPGFEGNRTLLDQPITFEVRFGPREQPLAPMGTLLALPPLPSRQVVGDRAFNGEAIARAYLGEAVQTVEANPTTPNEQLTRLRDGRELLAVVTARSTEQPQPDHFLAAERSQQFFRGANAPLLNIVETTSDYHREADGRITADQFTAIYLSPQDPDWFRAGRRPVALYRYRLDLRPLA